MTPEVQHYLLAGFLLLAAVFAVPLLKRVLTPVKKRISDRIPALVGHLLRCFLRPRHPRGLGTANHPVERCNPCCAHPCNAVLPGVCAVDGGVGRLGSHPGYLANAASSSAP